MRWSWKQKPAITIPKSCKSGHCVGVSRSRAGRYQTQKVDVDTNELVETKTVAMSEEEWERFVSYLAGMAGSADLKEIEICERGDGSVELSSKVLKRDKIVFTSDQWDKFVAGIRNGDFEDIRRSGLSPRWRVLLLALLFVVATALVLMLLDLIPAIVSLALVVVTLAGTGLVRLLEERGPPGR